jgi:peptidoglycan/xylan/chitin deacetylase (PgdA/CDA1 family)
MSAKVKGMIITTSWDDGHPLDFRVAELLAKHGVRGTFYVPFENSRPTLSPGQIRELARAFEIGAHTMHHCVLTTVTREEARAEVFQSKARLEEITGRPCTVFCFPKGKYSIAHVEMVREAGFSGARTVELLSFERPSFKSGIAMMPTTIQACPNPTLSYVRNAVKRFRAKSLLRLLFNNHGSDWAATAMSLLERCRQVGGVFHLWGHSWELEDYGQWKALDRVLGAMADSGRSTYYVTNAELCAHGGQFWTIDDLCFCADSQAHAQKKDRRVKRKAGAP